MSQHPYGLYSDDGKLIATVRAVDELEASDIFTLHGLKGDLVRLVTQSNRAVAICDGRGNAGTGAIACVLTLPDGREFERAERIDPTTNIVAEHLAIQLALQMALDHNVKNLLIYNDSQTPVHQIDGTYKINEAHLKPLVHQTWNLGLNFHSVEIRWVPREMTSRADLLCRHVDKQKSGRKRPGSPASQPPSASARRSERV
jgi:ribonuclease HI